MKKLFLWFVLGGLVYYAIEGLWHIFFNQGWANITMAIVGGLCFVPVGLINQIPIFYKASMRLQSLIGAIIVLIIELLSGILLNMVMGMNVWDYSDLPFNILGQVCLVYGLAWFVLMPFTIWLEDKLNIIRYAYLLFRGIATEKDKPLYDYTLIQAYKELITF